MWKSKEVDLLKRNRKRCVALERHLRRNSRDKQAARAWHRFYYAVTEPAL